MKSKQITLILTDVPDRVLYTVESLVNRIEPRVGSVLKPSEVQQYIDLRYTKVTIKRAKS
jgi:hypothetical protein